MSDYQKPTFNNIPFKFTSTGYTAPSFSNVPFVFGATQSYQQTADMKSTIEVLSKYCTSTYTYIKEKRTYVIGYSDNSIQILKEKIIYGGIRDLCASLEIPPLPEHTFDLFVNIGITEIKNL